MSNRKQIAARTVMTVLTAAAVFAIFYNSSLNAWESTEQSTPLTQWINSVLASMRLPFSFSETLVRKLAHFTEYAVMGALLTVTVTLYLCERKKVMLVALPIGAAVAVCDELIQLFSEGRACEVKDMLIDLSSVVFAALIVLLIISIIEKRRKNKSTEGRVNRERSSSE